MKPQVFEFERKLNLTPQLIKEFDEVFFIKGNNIKFIPFPMEFLKEVESKQHFDLMESATKKFLQEFKDYEYVGSIKNVTTDKRYYCVCDFFINHNENKFVETISEPHDNKLYLHALFIADIKDKEVS